MSARTLLLASLLGAIACAKTKVPPSSPWPELIGEGVISTPEDELGGTLTDDGNTIYFERSAAPHYLYMLYEAHRVNGVWQPPQLLPFSGRYRDTDPVLSPDGQSMLFASDRPQGGVDEHHFYIWQSERSGETWKEPQRLQGPVNDGFDQVFCSMTRTGTLYFTSSRKTGAYDIFRSRYEGGRYLPAEDLGPVLNGPGIYTFEALVAPDESYLLIGSFGRKPSYGSSDIYISYNENGTWTEPKNLGPVINTGARDYSPRISQDGKWFFFTSEKLDRPLPPRLTYRDFTRMSRSTFNHLGNLYRMPLEEVLAAASRKP